MRSHIRLTFVALVAVVAALILATGATSKSKPPIIQNGSEVEVQLLALNDFHGNIQPPAGSSGRVGTVNAGGAEYLATHVRELSEATNRNTFVVSAGDLIGASPLLSALFHDEPTIEAMNLDRPRPERRRQPRVRRGHHRAPAHAERRLSPGRRLPGRGPASRARTSSSSRPTSSTTTRGRRCSRRTRSSTSAARRSRSSA